MITLHYSGSHTALVKAVKKANEILAADAFYERIAALPQMSNVNLSSAEVAKILKQTDRNILISVYWNPFGKPSRRTTGNMLKVNISRLSKVTAFAVHTLIHETILNLGFLNSRSSFMHTDNSSDISETLPWKIGEIAEIITRKARKFA
jgi:hypothetical protein